MAACTLQSYPVRWVQHWSILVYVQFQVENTEHPVVEKAAHVSYNNYKDHGIYTMLTSLPQRNIPLTRWLRFFAPGIGQAWMGNTVFFVEILSPIQLNKFVLEAECDSILSQS
jgi:hypothetical protein